MKRNRNKELMAQLQRMTIENGCTPAEAKAARVKLGKLIAERLTEILSPRRLKR